MSETTEQEDPVQEHTYLLEDLAKAQKRAAKATFLEAKREFADECYPLLASFMEHFGARMERLEAAVDEMIEQTESFLQPDLAQQLLATLELGRQLADACTKLKAGDTLDAKTAARFQQLGAAVLTANAMTVEAVNEAALPPSEDEDDEDDAEEPEENEDAASTSGEEG